MRGEESPGSTEVRCRVTPGGGDPRESATERTPPNPRRSAGRVARVKRCGKSAPRRRQRRRQGKPHREQDQVGAAGVAARAAVPGGPPRRRSGRSREAPGNGRPRGMAIPARRGNATGGTEPGLRAVWQLPRLLACRRLPPWRPPPRSRWAAPPGRRRAGSEEKSEVFGHQHALVEDDLAPGDLPALADAAQHILALAA